MGTNLNFKSYGNEPPGDGGGGRLPGNVPLARQTSIYSLTFDELQSTMGTVGKDFGSMNMDELLKNIWSVEEIQSMASSSGAQDGGGLQRQGSLTLPRTLSTKTVDEVWKNISKEYVVGKDGGGGGGSNQPQRQQTLGEMTLEEFLVRAGVVREDIQLGGANTGGFFGNANGLGIGFQQTGRNTGFMGNNRISDNSNQIALQSPNLPLNVNGVRSNQQQLQQSQQQVQAQAQMQQHQQQVQAQAQMQQHQQQLFPKQPTGAYASSQMPLGSPGIWEGGAHLGSPGMRGGIVGMSGPGMNGGLIHNGLGIVGLGAGAVTVAANSPANQLSSDGIGKSNGDTSSVSPVPYVFNGGLRGRRSNGTVEKVVERRQRRMIKNRESAARSRARKQAYTMELEAEVAKLKEENEGLRKKQEEIMEMQKNQVVEIMNIQRGGKKQCLRRTQTGPW